jgi:hypothetical protein
MARYIVETLDGELTTGKGVDGVKIYPYNEWVSVKDRMPEEQIEVLVTREFPDGKGGTMRVLEIASFGTERWSNSKCWITNDFRRYPTEEIVAWKALPTPYVESEE